MPAIEIEIGEQEHQQRCCQDRFARGAPDPFGARRHVEHFGPEAEIDADIDQHRPAERGSGREHHAAFDHEQDGQEQRQQAGNADDDALIERQRIDFVLIGVGLPQIDLRQVVGAKLGDIGDYGAGIERDAEDSAVGLSGVRRIAGRRGDGDDAREAEVGPDQAGTDHAIMRHDDKPVDLFLAGIGEREHRPVPSGLAAAHFDAADDAVGAGRSRNLDAAVVGLLELDSIGQVDGGSVGANVNRVHRMRRRSAKERRSDRQRRARKARCLNEAARTKYQKTTSEAGNRRRWGRDDRGIPDRLPNRLCADFATGPLPARDPTAWTRCTPKLVAAVVSQSKNIPVYFQWVRQLLAGLVAAFDDLSALIMVNIMGEAAASAAYDKAGSES